MLPYLLGADLSSGCAILRVLHKETLASTAEHTAALHERFAKPVPCRDKTKLLLTLRQCLTDIKESQPAGSSPYKETMMQSVKTVTGGIRDLNNGKLYPPIERMAAGWAVMDADIRLNDKRCTQRGDSLQALRQGQLNSRRKSADSHTRVWIPSPEARATKARSRTPRDIGARGKNHESATLGKIVSRQLFLFCASCVGFNSGFVVRL